MKYDIELVSSTEHYSVSDENDKQYRINANYEENVGWENKEVIDDDTDEDITDTEIGKKILEAFKNK